MVLSVALLRRIAAGTSLSLLFIKTTSAASMAISAPAPIAIPTSAEVRAGASFMPSPTITTLPCFLRFLITLSLPSGRTPAMTSLMPALFAIAFAVFSLSPVSITVRMPISLSSAQAASLSSFITSQTAIKPKSLLS